MKKFAKVLAATALSATLCLGAAGFAACGGDGKSAYDLAVENGFTGTVTEWLDSLKGSNGTNGTNGTDGTNGTNGKSAYELAKEAGFTGTEEEWLAALNGLNGTNGTNGVGIKDISIEYTYKSGGKLYAVYTVTYSNDTTDTIEAEVGEAVQERATLNYNNLQQPIIWTKAEYQAFIDGEDGYFTGLHWNVERQSQYHYTYLKEAVTRDDVLLLYKMEMPQEQSDDDSDSEAEPDPDLGIYMCMLTKGGLNEDNVEGLEEPAMVMINVVESLDSLGEVRYVDVRIEIEVTVGQTLSDALKNYYLTYEYQEGNRLAPLTESMFDFGDKTFTSEKPGYYENVKIAYGEGPNYIKIVDVCVYPDESELDIKGANAVATYTGKASKLYWALNMMGSEFPALTVSKVVLYDNGVAQVYLKYDSAFSVEIPSSELLKYKLTGNILTLEDAYSSIVLTVDSSESTFTDYVGTRADADKYTFHLNIDDQPILCTAYAYANGIAEVDVPIGLDGNYPVYFTFVCTYIIMEQGEGYVSAWANGDNVLLTPVQE